MTDKWNATELENMVKRKCVCGRAITSGWLGQNLMVMHESPGCETYRKFPKAEEFLAHLAELDKEQLPRMSEDERRFALLEVIQEVAPRIIALLPKSRPMYPLDSTKIGGEQLRGLMELVGGNYGAMLEFIRIDADYLVSFGWLNMMLDFVRQQNQGENKVGNA